jgi:hypothetical protein
MQVVIVGLTIPILFNFFFRVIFQQMTQPCYQIETGLEPQVTALNKDKLRDDTFG